MAIFLYLFFIFINLFLSFKDYIHPFNKNSRRALWGIVIFSFIIIYLFLSGYRNYSGLSGDLNNLQTEYEYYLRTGNSIYEGGYKIFMGVGKAFTLEFYTWRAIIIFFALLLNFYSIIRYAKNPHLVIALFFIFLIIPSAEQLRNFLAFSFFQVGLSQLIYSTKSNKYKNFIFSLFVLIAGYVHSSFYIYIVILLIDKITLKYIKILVWFVLLFCVVIFLNNNNIPGFSIIINYFENSRVSDYLNHNIRFGFLLYMFLHGLSLYILYVTMSLTQKLQIKDLKIDKVFNTNLLLIIFFPLLMVNGTFIRIFRNILLLNYFSFGEFLSLRYFHSKKLIFVLIIVSSCVMWVYLTYFFANTPYALYFPFFLDNIYFR